MKRPSVAFEENGAGKGKARETPEEEEDRRRERRRSEARAAIDVCFFNKQTGNERLISDCSWAMSSTVLDRLSTTTTTTTFRSTRQVPVPMS
jgi:hypothetical protein